MNKTNFSETRSEFLFRIGKNIDSWHRLVGLFVEETNFGENPYAKTFAVSRDSRYRSVTITYNPTDGWGWEYKG